MADLEFPHLFLPEDPTSYQYVNPQGGGSEFRLPPRPSRQGHAEKVISALKAVWAESEALGEQRKAVALPTRTGTYVEFESTPEFDLKFKSLEARPSGIRLLNVREEQFEDGRTVNKATLYVPKGKEHLLIKKVERYRDEETPKNKPKNKDMVESIENLRSAVLQSFWYDPVEFLPPAAEPVWCEVWLRTDGNDEAVFEALKELCGTYNIQIREGFLAFPERLVAMVQASANDLIELLNSFDHIAEFRRAKETADFWVEMENADQLEWADNLSGRLSVEEGTNVSVCVIDTGANNRHPILAPLLADDDCLSIKPAEWGTTDSDGHGTAMCGTAAFADNLGYWLEIDTPVEIPYRLESVKLIPYTGYDEEQELNGGRTLQAISRAEVANPNSKRAICLAITSEDGRDRGRPSSWSGALDKLISGYDDDDRRLVIVAAGNVADPNEWKNYPDSNITNMVHDPGQSWNSLTVGAVTYKTEIDDADLAETYTPMAEIGQLSPYTTTSVIWESKWPNKPDVVFEGGNVGIDDDDFTTQLPDLSLLTLGHTPQQALFDINYATSAAAGIAAEHAGRLLAQYPEAWPETIRGLIVHSASWTEKLWDQFSDADKSAKSNREQLMRICGFGVPSLPKALASAEDSLTLIAEQTIQPFVLKEGKKSDFKANDMHLYDLPWPRDALLALPPETPLVLDVTLSYFVEPGPGEIGWRDKYRYRSHGLDFNIKKPTEDIDEFVTRLNKAARDDNDLDYGGSSVDWAIGTMKGRTRGSIHRDWVELTAAEAAETNVIGIFPRTGWWKERGYLGYGEKETRYSLIVSLKAPDIDVEVDLYTPVAVQIAPEIEVPIQ